MNKEKAIPLLKEGKLLTEFHGIRKIFYTIDGLPVRRDSARALIDSGLLSQLSVDHSGFTKRYYKWK